MARLSFWMLALLLLTTTVVSGCAKLKFPKRLGGSLSGQLRNDDSQMVAEKEDRAAISIIEPTGVATIESPADSAEMIAAEDEFQRGQQAEAAGNLELARNHYQQVIQREPAHWESHQRLGVIADQLGQFDVAEQHYRLALRNVPQNDPGIMSRLLNDIGYSFLLQGDYVRSEKALDGALQSDADNTAAMRNLAVVYGFRGEYARAMKMLTQTSGEAQARTEMTQLFPGWESHIAARLVDNDAQGVVQVTGDAPARSQKPGRTAVYSSAGVLQAPIPVQKPRVPPVDVPVVANSLDEDEIEPPAEELFAERKPVVASQQPAKSLVETTPVISPQTTAEQTKSAGEAALRWGNAIGPGLMFPTTLTAHPQKAPKPSYQQTPTSPAVFSGGATIKMLPYSGNSSVKTLPHSTAPRIEMLTSKPDTDGRRSARMPVVTGENPAVREFEARFEARRRKQEMQRRLNPNRE